MESQQLSEKIMPTLKNLQINEKAYFPLKRYSSVASSMHKVKMETESKFSYKADMENRIMIVTRIS